MTQSAYDLNLLIDMAEDCIFAHSDEAIYCKTVVLQWLNEGKYDKVVNILGGFHTSMVKLKSMYKNLGAMGFRDWWVDAGAIAEGSSVQAVEGHHYFSAIGLHKQSFEALLRYRIHTMGDVSLFGADFRHSLELRPEFDRPHSSAMPRHAIQVVLYHTVLYTALYCTMLYCSRL